MFTGIVELTGRIVAIAHGPSDARLTIAPTSTLSDTSPGQSIAVSGVCLTVTDCSDSQFTADVMGETLARTTLGERQVGDLVNLERALQLSDRLGGHIVTGHVDAVAKVISHVAEPAWHTMNFSVPDHLAKFIAAQGSVAIDGVSLTVARVDKSEFAVGLIPATLALTTLGGLQAGDHVNIETDMLAKYLQRLRVYDQPNLPTGETD